MKMLRSPSSLSNDPDTLQSLDKVTKALQQTEERLQGGAAQHEAVEVEACLSGACWYCHKVGHVKQHCRKLKWCRGGHSVCPGQATHHKQGGQRTQRFIN